MREKRPLAGDAGRTPVRTQPGQSHNAAASNAVEQESIRKRAGQESGSQYCLPI